MRHFAAVLNADLGSYHRDHSPHERRRPSVRLGCGAGRTPTIERVQLDERSWIDVVRGFLPAEAADALRDELLGDGPWVQGKVFRYEKWVAEPRFGAMQRGAGRHPTLVEAQDWIPRRYRVMFDWLALAWYRNERDSVGWHRDRELKWLEDTVIGVLTLGQQRPFSSRRTAARPAGQLRRLLRRRDRPRPGQRRPAGDGRPLPEDWLHAVPRVADGDARPGVGAVAVDVQARPAATPRRASTRPPVLQALSAAPAPRAPASAGVPRAPARGGVPVTARTRLPASDGGRKDPRDGLRRSPPTLVSRGRRSRRARRPAPRSG